ncbi:UNVERIFIED_CONTAM: Homeobox-leucine zipper protein ATHB-23 [Sesamum radiatum]|uniref:Homeobox-leucine zipper protein ATHB-23 n=1 Tax=Sesamum radiatum TaxID=300843 RepID=A0AAW2JSS1_SESRA
MERMKLSTTGRKLGRRGGSQWASEDAGKELEWRARWKTKQLEKDYDLLKETVEAVKAENMHFRHRIRTSREIMALKNKEPTESINLKQRITKVLCSNRSPFSHLQLIRPSGVAQQLFHNPSRPEIQCPKMDQSVKEESLCNMFCGMDDQTGFWPLEL